MVYDHNLSILFYQVFLEINILFYLHCMCGFFKTTEFIVLFFWPPFCNCGTTKIPHKPSYILSQIQNKIYQLAFKNSDNRNGKTKKLFLPLIRDLVDWILTWIESTFWQLHSTKCSSWLSYYWFLKLFLLIILLVLIM